MAVVIQTIIVSGYQSVVIAVKRIYIFLEVDKRILKTLQ